MEEPKSKSQKKREADALQKVGVSLVSYSLEKLDKLPLTEPLKKAILEAKSLKSHGAMRRQAQLIGKLMRAADHEAILAAHEQLLAEGNAQTAAFHEAEAWRSRLLHEGKEALTDFISAYPTVDSTTLRHLVKKALQEQTQTQATGANKQLFRYLRSFLE